MATTPAKTYDGSIADLAKSLITDLIKESQDKHGTTPLERIVTHVKYGGADASMASIQALSTYAQAKAAERQADAMEALAKTASRLQIADQVESGVTNSIVEQRESRREYLASNYSLPSTTLQLLWAVRGILVDASIKALSHPERFEPYRKVTTDELAWALRMSPEELLSTLPRFGEQYDYTLLEEFGIVHFDGTDEVPDGWMYGG